MQLSVAVLALVAAAGGPSVSATAIAPVMPGAGAVTAYELETTRAIGYPVAATPAEIKRFYRETLTAAGYSEPEPLVFTRGTQRLSVIVSPGVSERYVVV